MLKAKVREKGKVVVLSVFYSQNQHLYPCCYLVILLFSLFLFFYL